MPCNHIQQKCVGIAFASAPLQHMNCCQCSHDTDQHTTLILTAYYCGNFQIVMRATYAPDGRLFWWPEYRDVPENYNVENLYCVVMDVIEETSRKLVARETEAARMRERLAQRDWEERRTAPSTPTRPGVVNDTGAYRRFYQSSHGNWNGAWRRV